MEFMMVGVMPTQATLPTNVAVVGDFFFHFHVKEGFMVWHKTMVKGGGEVCVCVEGVGGWWCLVLFVQDNTQQHTEMLRGAIDSTDGRIM